MSRLRAGYAAQGIFHCMHKGRSAFLFQRAEGQRHAALAADEDVRTKYLGSGFVLKKSVSVERAKAEHAALEVARAAKAASAADSAEG